MIAITVAKVHVSNYVLHTGIMGLSVDSFSLILNVRTGCPKSTNKETCDPFLKKMPPLALALIRTTNAIPFSHRSKTEYFLLKT